MGLRAVGIASRGAIFRMPGDTSDQIVSGHEYGRRESSGGMGVGGERLHREAFIRSRGKREERLGRTRRREGRTGERRQERRQNTCGGE